jgi:hypothetical protein
MRFSVFLAVADVKEHEVGVAQMLSEPLRRDEKAGARIRLLSAGRLRHERRHDNDRARDR